MRTIRREDIIPVYTEVIPQVVCSRWVYFCALLVAFFIFSGAEQDGHVITAFLGLFFINSLLTALFWVTDISENTLLYRVFEFIGYFADGLVAAVLIGHTMGLSSPFVIAYAYLITMIAESGRIFDIVFYGIIFHVIYVLSVYFTYHNFHYFDNPQIAMVTILFAVFSFRAVWVAKKIRHQSVRLEQSKDALESFAAGLKASNETLEKLSYHDPVTGCYNFRYFRRLLTLELERADRYGTPLALLIVDLDNFRAYNERFGHQRGDKVLSEVADLIKKSLRDYDAYARFIADEFILALVDTDVEVAKILASRIRLSIEEHSFYGEHELPSGNLTVSIGIAVYPDSASNQEELVNSAEDALRKVQLTRNNQIRVYSTIVEELRDKLADSETMIDTLQTLLIVVNARDRYTFGHSERVAKYAVAIGQELGLPAQTLQDLKYAAFLHDVGKIEISREVLNKREVLADEEWDLLKQHPLFGLSIIEPIRNLQDLMPIIRSHHERFDGLGYPDGLAGEEIPQLARILAVADSFDAMRSNRPYRAALSKAVAVGELIKGKGSQFDPAVVEAFLRIVDKLEDEMEGLAG